jgi:two-component system sensor histidine kinase GlrK
MSFTIFRRMAAAHLVIMCFLVFMSAYVTVMLRNLSEINREVAQVDGFIIRTGERMQEMLVSLLSYEKKYAITGDPDFQREFGKTASLFQEEMGKLASVGVPWEKTSLVANVKRSFESYGGMPVRLQVRGEELERREGLANEINLEIKKIIMRARVERDQKVAQSDKIAYRVVRVISATAVLTVIVGVLLSFFMTRSIVGPISLLKSKTREIAQGRFRRIPPTPSPPEIRGLADDFNAMGERLKEMDELKRDFLSHVSHELRTPLTSIKAASAILSEGTFRNSPEKEREILAIVRNECERLIGTVNRLLDLSRMEAKMMDYQFVEADLAGVIRLAVLKLEPLARKKGILLELELPAMDRVRMDPERVSQVVENLLGNALKFTPENGRIRVDASPDGDGGFVRVSVSDTGIGIPQESLDQVFERFKRVNTGKGTVGTGLGLSIAKHIITGHGGRIWAESEPGKGSRFSFTLQRA